MRCWRWRPLRPVALLNLDYAIDEMLDEQDQGIIGISSCGDFIAQVAQEERLSSTSNWEQLKIMRIKFLSEYGMGKNRRFSAGRLGFRLKSSIFASQIGMVRCREVRGKIS